MRILNKNLLVLLLLVTSPIIYADDETIDACEAAATLLKENDIDGALEEASWCLEGIQQLKQQQTLALFPEEVGGFTGGETESQNVMGMKIVERSYSNGSENIEVSLVGGGAATSGLSILAQLGINMGDGGKKIRIQRRTVIDSSSANSVELMVQLKSKGMLTLKSSNASKDAVIEFAKGFPIKEIDESLDNG